MRSWRRSAAYRIAFANFIAFALGLALLGVVVFAVMHVAFSRAAGRDGFRRGADAGRRISIAAELGELKEAIADRESSHSPTRMLYAVFAPDGRRSGVAADESSNARRPRHHVRRPRRRAGPRAGYRHRPVARERLLVAADREWVERIDRTV